MPKFYRILGSIVVLFLIASGIVFSFTLILAGIVAISLYGLYRHYFKKTRTERFSEPEIHISGEVIDIPRKTDPSRRSREFRLKLPK
ncbi:Hypothetical protein DEACI_3362 [Acididesulfobacillus acetoxydans]|uniref:Uncharacterized protein n=1 Tax=Acididesulfobacillus acetoxydans TaxID=1561005 RepID=A0A8S0VY69_9FIRM|nr:hypothetical protein [Acididesulfobacillus acetoxydans]CAA7602683.1 Hypothetical protein DEACI_3362 [Acididesulfobacillus acetoxydans]CEJ09261.1 Hypothetical protein DEACI_3745 [Acididesulfobacillus acetoxydans]